MQFDQAKTIVKATLVWEKAYATGYALQAMTSVGAEWATVYNTTIGKGKRVLVAGDASIRVRRVVSGERTPRQTSVGVCPVVARDIVRVLKHDTHLKHQRPKPAAFSWVHYKDKVHSYLHTHSLYTPVNEYVVELVCHKIVNGANSSMHTLKNYANCLQYKPGANKTTCVRVYINGIS